MTGDDGDDGGGSDVGSCSRDVDVEDRFEPSLFAECDSPPPQWPDDLRAVFLAANLLMFYLNVARLRPSSAPIIDDTHPPPVTVADRDDSDGDNE